ncbi:hypothetical protein H5410_038296 [Solanum commersonii]|uniref:AMP-dependent synthetase/ligase domain-containing protein n=1 Tax=Solanum commersonii TaxID=4109 RepID=A0A9J5YBX9_SOLCO|nr:hypothetical protein H5410_038296 [Solanum commersonii]
MSMTMFGVKVEERKEGKNGQPSIGLVYRHPIAKIGFTPAYPDLCTAWRLLSPYNWKTYKEAYEEILQTVSALGALGIEHGAQIGIYGANCPWWIVVTEACSASSLICVPHYYTLASLHVFPGKWKGCGDEERGYKIDYDGNTMTTFL